MNGGADGGTPGIQVGMSIGSAPPVARVRRQVASARRLGFDSFWWQDHLLGFASEQLWRSCKASAVVPSPHASMDPFVTMAATAEDAGGGLIGVCVTDPVRRMPATILQTAMTLDHLAPGRVVIGLGSGEPMNYRPFGWDVPSPLRRLTEAAQSMRHYLDHATPDGRGGVMAIRPPSGSRGPQLWISAHGPKAQQVAGQYGDGWLCARGNVESWHEGWRNVARAAEMAGRDPARITRALSLLVAVHDDPAVVRSVLDHPVSKANLLQLPERDYAHVGSTSPLGNALQRLMPAAMDAEVARAAAQVPLALAQAHIPHGSPAAVAARIGQFTGVDHVILWNIVPVIEPTLAKISAANCAEVARLLKSPAAADQAQHVAAAAPDQLPGALTHGIQLDQGRHS
jgi:phthiodiolone/phenolphthiodiolone dimycocerosates ketoreductase